MTNTKLIVIIVACIAAAALLYWYFSMRITPTPSSSGNLAAPATSAPQTLGSAIYQGATNPIQDKIPDVNPVTNPVQGLYKNPFE